MHQVQGGRSINGEHHAYLEAYAPVPLPTGTVQDRAACSYESVGRPDLAGLRENQKLGDDEDNVDRMVQRSLQEVDVGAAWKAWDDLVEGAAAPIAEQECDTQEVSPWKRRREQMIAHTDDSSSESSPRKKRPTQVTAHRSDSSS